MAAKNLFRFVVMVSLFLAPTSVKAERSVKELLDKLSAMHEGYEIADAPKMEKRSNKGDPLIPEKLVILDHYKLAEGISFPSVAPVQEDAESTTVKEYWDKIRTEKPVKIGKCNSNKIVDNAASGKGVVFDTVYISADAPIGKNLAKIDSSAKLEIVSDSRSPELRDLGVTCLPYRIRIADGTEYRLMGDKVFVTYDPPEAN